MSTRLPGRGHGGSCLSAHPGRSVALHVRDDLGGRSLSQKRREVERFGHGSNVSVKDISFA